MVPRGASAFLIARGWLSGKNGQRMSRFPTRRRFLLSLSGCGAAAALKAVEHLPQSAAFKGRARFDRIVARGVAEGWSRQPVGRRVMSAALAMEGTPYAGFTLEIDDHIESPSVNFDGLDCWTFFETALGLARMFGRARGSHTPSDLLREIETTRYRDGICRGGYLERIHYLEEWFRDNARRGHVRDITASLGPLAEIKGRRIDEMTVLWKSYRYLANNPGLRAGMARIEEDLQKHAFHYLPKAAVRGIEPKLESGDIVGIVTHKPHVYCSHVGLILRDAAGACRFMHASTTHKRVLVDKPLHAYLADFKSHAGIIACRPL